MSNLKSRYEVLFQDQADYDWSGDIKCLKIFENEGHRIGVNSLGQTSLMLITDDLSTWPALDFLALNVRFGVLCTIESSSGSERFRCCIVTLKDRDPDYVDAFLDVFSTLIDSPNQQFVPRSRIKTTVKSLANIFKEERNEESKILGLWGELSFILFSADPTAEILAWHSDPMNKFDFNRENGFAEIKTTVGTKRSHHFSIDQLRPRSRIHVSVYSIMTTRTDRGVGVWDLAREILDRLSSVECQDKLVSQISCVAGSEILDQQYRFDLNEARCSFRCYPADKIPVPEIPIETPISDVRFCVDLSALP